MAPVKPYAYPKWTNGPGANVVQPDASLANTGWQPGQAPDAQNVNWLLWDIDAWIEYLDSLVEGGAPNAWMRLINGGNWSFNATTNTLAWSADANVSIPGVPDSANDIATGSVTIQDGQVAYAQLNQPFISNGNTQIGISQISAMNFTANLTVGMLVQGPGIPPSTTITLVGANFVNISNPASSNNTGATYIFVNTSPISLVVANESSIIPTPAQVLVAKRSGNVIYLGINASQMVLRDGEFKTLIGSGYFSLYQVTAGENLTKGQICYISPGASDGGRTAGAAYKLDCGPVNAPVRGTFAGMVITSVSTSQQVTLLFDGFFSEISLSPGVNYFADPTTPGGITSTMPSQAGALIVPIGFAISTTVLLVGEQSGVTGPQVFPIFNEDRFFGPGSSFTLSSVPLSKIATFPFVDGTLITPDKFTVVGSLLTLTDPIAAGQKLYVKYLLAGQAFLGANSEVPSDTGDHQHFNLVGYPTNQGASFLFIDGLEVGNDQWTLVQGLGTSQVILNSPISPAQKLNLVYFTTVQGTSAAGINNGTNLGAGAGIFAGLSGSVMQFKSLVAGAGITLTPAGASITIGATGGAGGVPETHGSASSPVPINPSVGISPTGAADQIWWITPSSGSGQVPITATPPIAAGITIGQRLTLKSISAANYLRVPSVSGVDQNGPVDMGPSAQSISYTWDGGAWSEDTRRV